MRELCLQIKFVSLPPEKCLQRMTLLTGILFKFQV